MIDITKEYRTRDGRKVRILCTDGPNPVAPVIGLIDGARGPVWWSHDGHPNGTEQFLSVRTKADLIEVRPTPEEVINAAFDRPRPVWAAAAAAALREAGYLKEDEE